MMLASPNFAASLPSLLPRIDSTAAKSRALVLYPRALHAHAGAILRESRRVIQFIIKGKTGTVPSRLVCFFSTLPLSLAHGSLVRRRVHISTAARHAARRLSGLPHGSRYKETHWTTYACVRLLCLIISWGFFFSVRKLYFFWREAFFRHSLPYVCIDRVC